MDSTQEFGMDSAQGFTQGQAVVCFDMTPGVRVDIASRLFTCLQGHTYFLALHQLWTFSASCRIFESATLFVCKRTPEVRVVVASRACLCPRVHVNIFFSCRRAGSARMSCLTRGQHLQQSISITQILSLKERVDTTDTDGGGSLDLLDAFGVPFSASTGLT